jgi:hypothetical protein
MDFQNFTDLRNIIQNFDKQGQELAQAQAQPSSSYFNLKYILFRVILLPIDITYNISKWYYRTNSGMNHAELHKKSLMTGLFWPLSLPVLAYTITTGYLFGDLKAKIAEKKQTIQAETYKKKWFIDEYNNIIKQFHLCLEDIEDVNKLCKKCHKMCPVSYCYTCNDDTYECRNCELTSAEYIKTDALAL